MAPLLKIKEIDKSISSMQASKSQSRDFRVFSGAHVCYSNTNVNFKNFMHMEWSEQKFLKGIVRDPPRPSCIYYLFQRPLKQRYCAWPHEGHAQYLSSKYNLFQRPLKQTQSSMTKREISFRIVRKRPIQIKRAVCSKCTKETYTKSKDDQTRNLLSSC